jgi:hypothetical protein
MSGQTLCGSTSTTAVTPALRIAGAAAASSCAARADPSRLGRLGDELRAVAAAQPQQGRGAEQLLAEPCPQLFEQSGRSALIPAGGDHTDEVAKRRVAELAPACQLVGEEARHVVVRGERDRPRVRLERLHEHASRRVAPAAAGELRDELKRALLGAEVRQA